jgi:hypothetical protein
MTYFLPTTVKTIGSQGCQMVYFKTKIPIWVRVLHWKMLTYFTAVWNILRTFSAYILCSFGTFFLVLVSPTNKNLATLLVASRLYPPTGRRTFSLLPSVV